MPWGITFRRRSRRGQRPGSVRHELDARRGEFCRPLSSYDPGRDELFHCELGTLFCTEAHGESWERPWYERNVLGVGR